MIAQSVIADSSIWMDFLAARRTHKVDLVRRNQALWDIRTTDLNLCEALRGAPEAPLICEGASTHELLGFDSTGVAGLAVEAAINFGSYVLKALRYAQRSTALSQRIAFKTIFTCCTMIVTLTRSNAILVCASLMLEQET